MLFRPMRFQVRAFASAGTAEKNYYQILGIDTVATDSQVKDAYRSLAKKYHPDVRSQSDSSAAEHDPMSRSSVTSSRPTRCSLSRSLVPSSTSA